MREIKLLILKNTVLEKKHREWLWNIGSGFFEAGENQQRRCEKTAKGQRREMRESKTSRFSAKQRQSCLPTIEKKKTNKQTGNWGWCWGGIEVKVGVVDITGVKVGVDASVGIGHAIDIGVVVGVWVWDSRLEVGLRLGLRSLRLELKLGSGFGLRVWGWG